MQPDETMVNVYILPDLPNGHADQVTPAHPAPSTLWNT